MKEKWVDGMVCIVIILIGLTMMSCTVPQSAETEACLDCHLSSTPGIVAQWENSKHYLGAVGCFECHTANESDVDVMDHFGTNISIIVSPLDCSRCHSTEVDEFTNSHHAEGGEILDSLDNVLAEIVEGYINFYDESPVAVAGCAGCHGSRVKVTENGSLDPASFPNSGIGRLNPDGSKGACSACHNRHDFSKAQARRPENCGRCHLGPDHPQLEVYQESPHGILFDVYEDEMNLDSDDWVVGVDYTATPTCASCHMGATPNQIVSHDTGHRLSWNIRDAVSSKRDNWETNRSNMQDVCSACHAQLLISNFYEQFDAGVNLYNDKFASPAKEIYDSLRSTGIVDAEKTFDDWIEWSYWYLWHHEGRRARTGLAMIGPDYVQWHGFYDIAERFYFDFIPVAIELCEDALDDTVLAADAQTILDRIDEILNSEMHEWF
ncbi:MAG: hydroxylamine oxidoreductase [Deltaproteobacteria bacterium]|nr:hydroxylamine oxidoreductase [Deltaproteobacteria bacterium]